MLRVHGTNGAAVYAVLHSAFGAAALLGPVLGNVLLVMGDFRIVYTVRVVRVSPCNGCNGCNGCVPSACRRVTGVTHVVHVPPYRLRGCVLTRLTQRQPRVMGLVSLLP